MNHRRSTKQQGHPPPRAARKGGLGSPGRVLATLSLLALGPAFAQDVDQLPIVGLHYQELLSGDDANIVITVPKPALSRWDGVGVQSDDACLALDAPQLDEDAGVWRIPAVVTTTPTCRATVTVSMTSGAEEWRAAVLVGVQWVPATVPSVDGRTASISYGSRLGAGALVGDPTRIHIPFVEATITNYGSEPITSYGFSAYPLLHEIFGPTYLETVEGGFVEYVELAPGADLGVLEGAEQATFGFPIDLGGRLVNGPVVVTLGTLPQIEVAGERFRVGPQAVYTFDFGPLGR